MEVQKEALAQSHEILSRIANFKNRHQAFDDNLLTSIQTIEADIAENTNWISVFKAGSETSKEDITVIKTYANDLKLKEAALGHALNVN